jgi:hypothetical protein
MRLSTATVKQLCSVYTKICIIKYSVIHITYCPQ